MFKTYNVIRPTVWLKSAKVGMICMIDSYLYFKNKKVISLGWMWNSPAYKINMYLYLIYFIYDSGVRVTWDWFSNNTLKQLGQRWCQTVWVSFCCFCSEGPKSFPSTSSLHLYCMFTNLLQFSSYTRMTQILISLAEFSPMQRFKEPSTLAPFIVLLSIIILYYYYYLQKFYLRMSVLANFWK